MFVIFCCFIRIDFCFFADDTALHKRTEFGMVVVVSNKAEGFLWRGLRPGCQAKQRISVLRCYLFRTAIPLYAPAFTKDFDLILPARAARTPFINQ